MTRHPLHDGLVQSWRTPLFATGRSQYHETAATLLSLMTRAFNATRGDEMCGSDEAFYKTTLGTCSNLQFTFVTGKLQFASLIVLYIVRE